MRELTSPQRPGRHPHSLILQGLRPAENSESHHPIRAIPNPTVFLSGFSATRSYRGAPRLIAIAREGC